ncbi:glycoside hydrolase family 43 protein [Atractiella rhizophila]|nr:glycoside hydrolase family 43 protein [Atractiella rhizophila]
MPPSLASLLAVSLPALISASPLFFNSSSIGPHLDKRSVSGPAINSNFPDPSLIWVPSENLWYAYGTNGNGKNVQVATSANFNAWTLQGSVDALPNSGSWSAGNVWAPMVAQLDNGQFVMYYAATSSSLNTHCIGVATSSTARGPYTPQSQPWVCHETQGGSIDAAFHHHPDGTKWVVYKIDGNSLGNGGTCNNGVPPYKSTPLMLQQVSAADGFTKIGGETQVLDRDDGDGPLIEAPSLIHVNGVWFLFFSSGCYAETTYDLSYAYATNVKGPYTKKRAPVAPTLVTGDYGLKAPGSACFAKDGSKVVFHAFLGNDINSGRGMWTGIPTFSGTDVTL